MELDHELGEIFGLVADPTRLEILKALWEERTAHEGHGQEPVDFSTLREAVGVRDSGRFNYHLDSLVPEFVSQEDDGYTLTFAGSNIVGAAV
jgi:DNA-binding transcriptional ArsR family regulator